MNNKRWARALFLLNFIKHFPKIILRFLGLLFLSKKLVYKDFRPNVSYCIEGTLNQLLWNIENSIFITLNNSSKLFFDSGQLLFHVSKSQTEFQLTAYGIGKKRQFNTQIKVICIEKLGFENINAKSPIFNFKKLVAYPNISIQHVKVYSIYFQKVSTPKLPIKPNIVLDNSHFLKKELVQVLQTKTINSVHQLKLSLLKNQ
ncbi:hypothetical protein [uncultured Croceitalea sp.]|uniref:hypothetical protein n=1 Tax=uncultured Croceitalea sp. TaxID=1798908 RepID=UPI003305DECF